MLVGEGTPIDDHRASAAYRAAMLGHVAAQVPRENPTAIRSGGGVDDRAEPAPGPKPAVGRAIPHESAALHVTGHALYTDDLVDRHKESCTPSRCRPRTPTPG